MLVLHVHWQLPRTPADPAGVLFWAETSDAPQPARQAGRVARAPRPKAHPFCLAPGALERALAAMLDSNGGNGESGPARPRPEASVPAASVVETTLRLPTTRTGPQPSPGLLHDWELDDQTPPWLAPWRVTGEWLPAVRAVPLLASLPRPATLPPGVALGADAAYWRSAAGLVLEVLAAQKLAPVLVPADAAGRAFHARWLPMLDSPLDAARLVRLAAAMPPICRAAGQDADSLSPPRVLLDGFLKATTDALARHWGQPAMPRLAGDTPAQAWLAALVSSDPGVRASPAQLQALANSQRAWLRNLHPAGNAALRVAFRLEAPSQLESVPGRALAPAWQLHFHLQARDDPSLLLAADAVWQARGDALQQLGRRFEQPQETLLAGLGYAARLFPPIAAGLKAARPMQLPLDNEQAYTFLRQVAPVLEEAGFGVLVPPWWNQPGTRLGVRLRLRPSRKAAGDAISQGKLTLEKLVHFEWQVALGDTPLTRQEFEALAALKSPLVNIRGQWVQLDPEQIEAAIRFWEKQQPEGDISLQDALRLGLGAETEAAGLPIDGVSVEDWLADWLQRFTGHEALLLLPQPAGLRGELRPYQRHGYSWLHFLRRWGLGACLADDMGLGKTVQTIALLLREKEELGRLPAPTLLVCPTSVVTNWEREVRRFAPGLTTLVHQGPERLRGDAFGQAARQTDMVLTSYAVVRRDAGDLQAVDWLGVILDEAQNIKNPAARQTQLVRQLPATFRLALTGTPVENRLSELWSIMHFLNPGYLGSRQRFRQEYALPIERYADQAATQRLKTLVQPFILRRVKSDPRVIQDLPEKIETKVYCQLSEEQATLYEAVVQQCLQQVEASEGIERRGLVLSMLMQLKQICNHPLQYLHQVPAGPAASGRRRRRTEAEEPPAEPADLSLDPEGAPDAGLAGRSGKLARLLEMLEETVAVGDRALVFTQFAELGQLLRAYLPRVLGCPVDFLHGGVPVARRDAMVKRFQAEGAGAFIFILSLKAGGTGLNLTRANHVFHFDRWWNPAVEDQATDRAYRIGQQRNVQVHKFISTGTLEERIDDMIKSKKALAQAVVGSGEQWLTELSTDDLRRLVELRRQ